MQCPLCIETVLEPRFHNGVEIDVCPKCQGVWLDRGELAKLVDTPTEARRDRAAQAADDRRDDTKKSGKKKSGDKKSGDKKSGDKKSGKKKRKKGRGERLLDALEDVLDFD